MRLKEKSDNINDQLIDLRAEFLVSCLLNEDVNPLEVLAILNGDLKRKWTKDIDFTDVVQFENNTRALNLHLNRTGLYDVLPEALFHGVAKDQNATGEEMARDSMRLKEEEKSARLFFMPIENEFFLQSVQLSGNETKQFEGLFLETINGLIPDFWRIDERIPENYTSKLVKLLPYAHKIVGNYKLTAEALRYIIDEEVQINLMYDEPDNQLQVQQQKGGGLGDGVLGQDMIIGQTVSGFLGQLTFKIGPLNHTQAIDFHNEGPTGLLVNCFVGYFTPMEYDVKIQLVLEEEKNSFFLSDNKGEGSNLGFDSVL